MSRKNKIIVSVVGIMIVLLALLGITYAYYLTRIQGNTNTNSISLTTANLLLKYDDGSGAIEAQNVMPGATFTKTFSVTNDGNATVDNYVVYLEEVINDLTRTQDLTYTLTCDNCAGSNGVYPKFAGIIATNSIEVGETHTYTLTVTYENLTDTDQSVDMGSRISGYIQIYNLTDIVDITGSIVNATDGDYVQINSEPKISQIVDGKYMLGAIEPGSHTITVRYKDSNGDEQIRSTKDIVIQKGTTSKVEGNVITVTNDSQTVTLNINATDSNGYEITNTIKDYNPYEGILAFTYANGRNVNITTNKIVEDVDIKTNAVEYPFSITNVSDEHQEIKIKLSNISIDDSLKHEDFRWGLYNADTNKGISFGVFKYVGDEEVIYADTIIDAATPDITKNYILRIWVHNNGTTQSDLLNKKFSAKINVESNPIEYTDASCFTMDNTDIIGYDVSCGKDVVVPRTINGSSVTLIGMQAFADQYGTPKISSVILPSSIQYIVGANFSGYSSEYFFLPENVTTISNGSGTGMGTFEGAAIKKMYLPEGLNSITQYTFMGSQIEEMVIPGTLTTIPDSSISSMNIKSLVLMNGVTSIGSSNIISSQLKTLEIPSSVNTISNSAISELDTDLDNIIVRGKSSINDFTGDASGLSGLGNVNIIYRQN